MGARQGGVQVTPPWHLLFSSARRSPCRCPVGEEEKIQVYDYKIEYIDRTATEHEAQLMTRWGRARWASEWLCGARDDQPDREADGGGVFR